MLGTIVHVYTWSHVLMRKQLDKFLLGSETFAVMPKID